MAIWPKFEETLLACCDIKQASSDLNQTESEKLAAAARPDVPTPTSSDLNRIESEKSYIKLVNDVVKSLSQIIKKRAYLRAVRESRFHGAAVLLSGESQEHLEEWWLTLAAYAQNPERLAKLVKGTLKSLPIHRSQNNPLVHHLMVSNLLTIFSRQAFDLVVQRSKALNNIAYANARLDVQLKDAYDKSEKSLSLLDRLEHSAKGGSDPLFRFDYEQSRAFKLDTQGWIQFRRDKLDLALHTLNKACDLMSTDADIHYHLARVYTENLHLTWKTQQDVKASPDMPDNLLKALRHWHEAQRYDVEERLFSDLMRLRRRLAEYEQDWKLRLFDQWKQENSKTTAESVKIGEA
jgi:hypothetical protein